MRRLYQMMAVCLASLLLIVTLDSGTADARPGHGRPHWGGHSHFYDHGYPGYGSFFIDGFRFGFYYRSFHVAPPPVVYAPPPVQYFPPMVIIVQPPKMVPLEPATPPSSSCLVVREYLTEIKVGNKTVEGYGYACLQPDGSWRRDPPVPVPYQ